MTPHELFGPPCVEVLSAVVMFVDGEISDTSHVQQIESHVESCIPCRNEIAHERRMHQLMNEALQRSCCEKAPQELHDQIAAIAHQGATFFTEVTMTEISIEIDEFGQVERHEITIEHSQEFRLPPQE
ncbi:MAG: hypothetical protein F2704_03685 [Actinobacteria bacterium]|uniref:Unannotated protein n=1 Tax=freshwater metagenome TaxID=449393 RepID=A0A6J6LVE2_9ZZZZ|nr:hypothetical protein [Actinomycetota bacterium]MSW47817.1 hypothetical protein [Actinomycetota bacterium]MSX24989.1 hypothetical protein [Actinomycetota bacterium]MSY46608.1 hypothetical protein [Actinomycetota bacterium]MSY57357.1 hypothetical protein [Actinomycetota bacterium]